MDRDLLVTRWLALATLVVMGCTVDGSYSAEGFACDEQRPCPSGFDCLTGVCTEGLSPFDGGTFDGGGETDAADIVCLPFVEFSDTFDGPDIDVQWDQTVPVGTSLELGDGELVLTPGVVNPTRFARIRSAKVNFADRRVAVEIVEMVNTATPAMAELRINITNQEYFLLRQTGGVLQFGVVEFGAFDVRAALPYDAQAQRWWQFREIDGELIADTSPDGQAWTVVGAVTHAVTPEFRVTIAAGTEERVDEPGSLHIDNLNSGSSLCE